MRRRDQNRGGRSRRLIARLSVSLGAASLLALALAPNALATYGRGLWGEPSDMVVTIFGLILIGFFAGLVFLLSMLQGYLEKRKEARKAAEKAAIGQTHLNGGW